MPPQHVPMSWSFVGDTEQFTNGFPGKRYEGEVSGVLADT